MLNEALKRVMESKNLSEEEVTTAFAEFVKENYPEIWTQAGQNIGNLDEEDLDFFSSAFEVNSVRRKGSGGKGDTWVGMIVAYDGTRDMMQRQRDTAIDAAEINLGQALRYGIRQGEKSIGIGRVVKQDGEWVVKSADDSLLYKESASDDKMPLWVIAINNGASHICLLKDDGRSPKRAFMKKRKWLFIGNTQDKFLSEGALPPMTLECSFGASEVELQMLRPITFKAEMEKAWKPAGSDEPDENQLVALDIDPDYGLGWVDDEILPKVTQLFAPDQFIANFMPTVDLANVFDYHMENRKVLSSGKDFGPLFGLISYGIICRSYFEQNPFTAHQGSQKYLSAPAGFVANIFPSLSPLYLRCADTSALRSVIISVSIFDLTGSMNLYIVIGSFSWPLV
jgi:hypothetical protein